MLVGLTMSCSRVGHAAGRLGRGLSMGSLHGPTGARVGPGTSNWGRSAQKQLPGYCMGQASNGYTYILFCIDKILWTGRIVKQSRTH